MVAVGEYYRSSGNVAPAGIYRVVGTSDEVTLLRVGAPEGRRRHSGEIVSVPAERMERAFEPADEPDTEFAAAAAVRDAVENLYWSVVAVWYALVRRL